MAAFLVVDLAMIGRMFLPILRGQKRGWNLGIWGGGSRGFTRFLTRNSPLFSPALGSATPGFPWF